MDNQRLIKFIYIILILMLTPVIAFAVDIRAPGFFDDGKTGYAVERRMAYGKSNIYICSSALIFYRNQINGRIIR